jgi:hypothetical protein
MTRARDVADTQENLGGGVAPFVAGKNKIINGDFNIWQRGTSFTAQGYTADRFFSLVTSSTFTLSQQTFSPGTAPVAGYEGTYFARNAVTSANTSGSRYIYQQLVEDVRTLAGQTVTFSFWAKADAAKNIFVESVQLFGTGGSTALPTFVAKQAITTSWARYSFTFTMPSVSGKTIGPSSSTNLLVWMDAGSDYNARTGTLGNQSGTFDFWGWQLEAGNVATPFTTASGTIGGELALCQRYLPAIVGDGNNFLGVSANTSDTRVNVPFLVTPRVRPTGLTYSSLSHFSLTNPTLSGGTPTAISFVFSGTSTATIGVSVSAGSPTIAAGTTVQVSSVSGSSSILFTGCEL